MSLFCSVATKYRWEVLAWCLMPNHCHLVLRAPEDGLLRGISGAVTATTPGARTVATIGADHLFRNRFRWVQVLE